MYEREIRASLSKLERLSVLLPETEPQKKRAEKDLQQLNEQFGQLMMQDANLTEGSDQNEASTNL